MTPMSNNWLIEVARRKVMGAKIEHRFGANRDLGAAWETICTSGEYHTPAGLIQLELVSDSALDAVGNVGAHSVEIHGINEDWDEFAIYVNLNGLTPVQLPFQVRRVHTMHIHESGTYAQLDAGSHAGNIYLRDAAIPTDIWADIIIANGFPMGVSEIGCYTVPRGHTAYIIEHKVVMEANKLCDVAIFHREKAHQNGAGPYSSMFSMDIYRSIGGLELKDDRIGLSRPLVGPCDTGFIAATSSGTANISVSYSILVIDNNVRDTLKFDPNVIT